jgi:pimeloyl-ACP methyl ester carboxylesterase
LLGWLGIAAAGAALVAIARAGADADATAGAPARPLPPPAPPPEPPGRWLEGAGGRLFVRTATDDDRSEPGRPALLLLHGLAGTGGQWEPQAAALAPLCRVLALDLRGHGRSSRPPDGDYRIATHAGDVLAVADALGLERFLLVGHSFGASVAIEVAATRPDRVQALGLVDPGGDTAEAGAAAVEAAIAAVTEDPRGEFERHYREFLHGGRPATSRRVLAELAATPEEVLVGCYRDAMRYPIRARLAAYGGPVLCLAGSLNDAPGSLTRIPGMAVEWLAPASHWLMLDRPEQTSGLLAELVQAAISG